MKIADIILENADIPTSQSEMADEILQGFKNRSGIRNPSSNNVNIDIASREAWLLFQNQGNIGMDDAIQQALAQQGVDRSGNKIKTKTEPKTDSKPEPRKPSLADPKPKKPKRKVKTPDKKDSPKDDDWKDETGWQKIKRRAVSGFRAGSELANWAARD